MIQRTKTAVIVAAGRSTRLHPLTLHKPKGLLEIGGETLLGRSVRILKESGIGRIAVVIGFEGQQIVRELGDSCTYLVNPYFPLCNNMGSLWFAREFVGHDPFVYLHGDLIYDPKILQRALDGASSQDDVALVTDFGPADEEAMKVRADAQGLLIESNKEIPLTEAAGEWTGIALIGSSGPRGTGPRLFEVIEEKLLAGEYDHYDTAALTRMASEGFRIRCSPTNGLAWKEIDFAADYAAAQALFAPVS